MSAVLGPIHEWMYNKVIFQEKIISEIAAMADENGLAHSIEAKTDFPRIDEVIDLSNIHGSLSGMIDEAESRYAAIVAELLQTDAASFPKIEKAVIDCGMANAMESQKSAAGVYKLLEDILLDGMPCDHSMQVRDSSDERVEVMRTLDTHSKYWEDAGLHGALYYKLRKALINGLLSQSGYTCNELEDGVFEIVKPVAKTLQEESYGMGIGSKIKAAPLKRKDGADDKYAELKVIENHPIQLFALENEAISEALNKLREAMRSRENLLDALDKARELSIHYAEKGDLLYPLLKLKYHFAGPTDVMWTVDDEIRDEMKALSNSARDFETLLEDTQWNERLEAVVTRAEEMIYKEENIIFPLCAKNFTKEEWGDIARDFDDYKPCLIEKRPLWEKATPKKKAKEMAGAMEEIYLPSGHMKAYELDAMLNTIPMELTFIDADSVNKYFNDGTDMKLFKRPLMAIDREVFSCHPPKVEPMVRSIIEDFRKGNRDCVDIWSSRDGHPVLVKYMAVRDKDNQYVGTLECVQNMDFAEKHFGR
ncbi:MAG: PAS domain-containing protein [Pseudobutyrivibrio sp.]|nr:PAS domain-containing protein [Pseudobutyrivibrio sp.]